ncbi:hypothetical protein CCP4SC76_5740011 [Gammaproteobacteria bacterium]
MMMLRDYQLKAVEATRRIIANGTKSVLINSPTGSGKTVIAATIVQGAINKGKSILFLAHRRELIQQCSAKLTEAGILNHGVIMAGSGLQNCQAPAQVASIHTLIRREFPKAHIIMIDECHRSICGQYKTILDHYPGAIVIGLSATPERLDGKGLSDLFSSMVIVDTVPGLIARGYLVKPICYAGTESDLSQVRTSRGDYRESDLQDALDKPTSCNHNKTAVILGARGSRDRSRRTQCSGASGHRPEGEACQQHKSTDFFHFIYPINK